MKQRVVVGATLLVVACGSACGSSEETETPAARTEGETAEEGAAGQEAAEAVEEAAEEAEPPNAATRDIHGLRVTLNDDGSITLSGVDRWGARLDTTYADATYFRNAVEVLKRSITEEQGAGLDAYLTELPAPEGGEAPPPTMAPAPTMRATMQTNAPAPATMEPAAAE